MLATKTMKHAADESIRNEREVREKREQEVAVARARVVEQRREEKGNSDSGGRRWQQEALWMDAQWQVSANTCRAKCGAALCWRRARHTRIKWKVTSSESVMAKNTDEDCRRHSQTACGHRFVTKENEKKKTLKKDVKESGDLELHVP